MLLALISFVLSPCPAQADAGVVYTTRDSPFDDGVDPALANELRWEPQAFEVRHLRSLLPGQRIPLSDTVDVVNFASPHVSEDAFFDRVAVRWHTPRNADRPRPAVVLVHSLHPETPIAESLARTIAQRGVHAFVVELPGYGTRRRATDEWPGVVAVRRAAQAVADVRRACDAVAALPAVDPDRIVLQGTSLGSFPAAVAAGLGARHHSLVLLLGGGNVIDAIEHGEKDAANFRATLERHGIDRAQRAELFAPLEPLRVADRLDPQTTWLLAARNDVVIPPANAEALAEAIGLDDSRFVRLPGNHYTAALALPAVADLLVRIAEADNPAQLDRNEPAETP